MSEPARNRSTYEDLYDIPANATGEIVDGELIVTPRPSRKHVYTATALGTKIDPLSRTLDVFRLEAGRWMVIGLFAEDDKVRCEPFQGAEIELNSLWLEKRRKQSTEGG